MLPRKVVQWDPSSGKFPVVDEKTITVVPIASLADMQALIAAIRRPDAPWRTVAIDSLTVFVRIGERELVNETARDSRQEYKKLYTHLEQEVLIPLKNTVSRNDLKADVLVATAWQDAERFRPAMTGSIKQSVDHLFDLIAQVQMTFENGKIGQIAHIMPTPGYQCKAPGTFYLKYGEDIKNPNLSVLNDELANKETA